MANIEQKRADLEKALQAIDEDEMEAVAGGLSKNAKLALQIGGAVAAALLVTGGASAAAYFGAKSGAKSDTPVTPTTPATPATPATSATPATPATPAASATPKPKPGVPGVSKEAPF